MSITRRAATLTLACLAVIGTGGAKAAEGDPKKVTTAEVREPASKACSKGRTYKIAYSHSVSEAAIVKQIRTFATRRATELGCVTVLHDNTQANNLEQQINAVQGWITLGVDAIVVTPIDVTALKPLQKQAQTKNIKWLTYLGRMDNSDGFVGFDHEQSGQLIANAAIDWVKSQGITKPRALVTTLTGLPLLSPRWTEVEKLFAKAGIEVVAKQDAADQATGLTVTETVLRQHPDLDIVIGLNDDAAVGANRAVTVAGISPDKFFIGGQDGSLEGLTAVNQGKAYKASAAILINDLGANIVDLSLNAINGDGPSFAYTPTVLATKKDQPLLDKLLANYGKK
ncbi:sugar ABC transporter substrate-binding protein [Methylorubrum populi]|uniref:sugar ABC transporter substrate-binding protein n=1 Tax=Methylorubrum populi TaxID=223967 RepID=UPI00164804BE|nr:sugar ABC transporter substrate-binding protein [Methylorubrum populi]